jgi:hypothetical protein
LFAETVAAGAAGALVALVANGFFADEDPNPNVTAATSKPTQTTTTASRQRAAISPKRLIERMISLQS